MKFYSKLDAQMFLVEIENVKGISDISESYLPTNEELTSFIKKRTPLVKKLKDYRKSATQKANWRENRYKMMKGIKAFHKSVEGKRYHRRLSRFLSSRITREKSKETNEELEFKTLMEKQGTLKGLNAAKQHLFVELEYFHTLDEQIEIEEFLIDYALPYFRTIEEKVVKDVDLNDDELVFLFDLTEKNSIITSLSDRLGKKFEETEKLWESIKQELENKDIAETNEAFYPMFFKKLKEELDAKN